MNKLVGLTFDYFARMLSFFFIVAAPHNFKRGANRRERIGGFVRQSRQKFGFEAGGVAQAAPECGVRAPESPEIRLCGGRLRAGLLPFADVRSNRGRFWQKNIVHCRRARSEEGG